MKDNVHNPAHYTQFKIQPIEFFRANRGVLDFLQMCVIKYVCRYRAKNGKEDLLKARNYIDMMIEDWEKEHPHLTCGFCHYSAGKVTTATFTCDGSETGVHGFDEEGDGPFYRCNGCRERCCKPLKEQAG